MLKTLKYLFLILPALFIACNEDLVFEIGGKYVNENMRILFTDTMSLDSYTVKWDSIVTSNFNTMLSGELQDSVFGNIMAKSYTDVKLPVNLNAIPQDAIYDSLRIVLICNGYTAGDTLQAQTIYVNRLEEKLKARNDGNLYSTSSFDYNPVPIGQVTFTPRPNSMDSVNIRLSDLLGMQLFNALKHKEDIVMDQSSFQNFMKGFVIDPDADNTCVIGFHSQDTIPLMQLYYHYFDFEEIHKRIDFVRYNPKLQFNQISDKDQNFVLPGTQKDKVSAKENNGESYIQAGTGIFTRIEIPYFNNFRELSNNIEILHANLILEPTKNSYTKTSLPRNISASFTDNSNRFVTWLTDVYGYRQVAELEVDDMFHEDTRYTFDVTDFVNVKLKEQTDAPPALLITVTPNEVYTTLDKLVLGSRWHKENKAILEVYYMIYE